MRFVKSRHIALLAALISAPASSLAQTSTTADFTVQITIQAACQINSAGLLNFGNSGFITGNVDATSQIVVQCTSSTPYSLGLSAGAGTGATVANRLMTGPSGATVSYSLYRDSAHTLLWGNTIGTDRQTGTGTGGAQTYTVYGQVPPQTTPVPGVYTDTVRATLTY
ncbi:spore coat U domain-containing protein [Agrobacterium tumefaciens]|nr:spore coat U domain-containing protein [Agrobacterium tumefaciens]TQN61258.1 spore coat U domain-containing protein [Agrobacterium tumefaciens]